MNTTQTSSFSLMQRSLKSMHLDSLMPLSTTLESSIASAPGGPDSNDGDANCKSSMPTEIVPSSGESGYGRPGTNFTPAMTLQPPSVTVALPSRSEEHTSELHSHVKFVCR